MKLIFTIDGDGDLLLKTGQKVTFKDPLVKKKVPSEIKIPIASSLGISPNAIFKALKKFVGDEIKKGELIAEHKSLITTKHYKSEHDGIIKEINHEEGVIVIETLSNVDDIIFSFFQGQVINVENREITLEIEKYKEFEIQSISEDFGGELLHVSSETFIKLSEDEVKNKIVSSEKLLPYEQIKLETLGANGFITLKATTESKSVPAVVLKNNNDLDTIKSTKFPYCLISKKHNKIYIYV